MNRKSLLWFISIAFGIAWILFTIPILFKGDKTIYPTAMTAFFALAMWAPGIAAIFTTLHIDKQPFKSLRLNTIGPKRFYFVAWFLPLLTILGTFGLTLLIHAGTFDPSMTMMRESLAKVPPGTKLPSAVVLVVIQSVFAITLAPFINVLFAMGEELGWRGFLLPKLMPLGQWKAIIVSGMIWGFWHAPTTVLHGYNFPQHHYLGVLVMIVGCTLLGTILSWLYLKTRSPWAPALGHGAFNAMAGIPFFFLKPNLDTALGGSPLGVAGWIPMVLIIGWLVYTKSLPVSETEVPETETFNNKIHEIFVEESTTSRI